MSELVTSHCVPCSDPSIQPLSEGDVQEKLNEISGWHIGHDNKRIERTFTFGDFKKAMVFVNRVAEIAESEGHHPDISIHYNEVTIELWTHSIGGLHENDFIVAAKINTLM
jgi:4a-hydroxytetrahydrobiopterin dehydratase